MVTATASKSKSKKSVAKKESPKKVAGKSRPPKGSKPLKDFEREHYNDITNGEKLVRELELQMEADREVYGAAKKMFQAADRELRMNIRRGPNPHRSLPFDGAQPNGQATSSANGQATPDAWRNAPLSQAGVSGKPLELLVLSEGLC